MWAREAGHSVLVPHHPALPRAAGLFPSQITEASQSWGPLPGVPCPARPVLTQRTGASRGGRVRRLRDRMTQVSEKLCSQWMQGQAIFLSIVAVNLCQDKLTKLQCFLKRAFHASSFGVAALPLAGRGSSACSLQNYCSQMTMRSGPPPSLTALPSLCRRELLETTCRLANTLKRHGVHRGDRVAIYMSVSPLAVAAMLACARIGAIHTVVFAGFSAGSLAARINDGEHMGSGREGGTWVAWPSGT